MEESKSISLYESDEKNIHYEDVVKALKSLGIRKGDTLLVHSDVSVFGKPIRDKKLLLDSLVYALQEVVGRNGTIVMPTFTYSFCNGKIYDKKKSRSTVGALTEHFRNMEGVKRTIHPIFSFAIWGKNTEYLLDTSKDSFDKNSVFGKIHSLGGKMVSIGSTFEAFTFMHYIEQSYGVPHRYMKVFKGTIVENSKTYEDEYTYYVRSLEGNVIVNFERFEKYLKEKNLIYYERLGNSNILLAECNTVFEEGFKLLSQNPFYLLKENPF
ncbi:AAC(3) family N-acetyltransferase [Clostridium beijerinckii]|uniref:AAC(3) family N-acetyltransferase n=1 Tax=Clostridium beijerinckii TaxID=1520 RepID=UPI0022E393E1|nr:AAC(3) family N-acetyltransferase [Clostridium beijerinckii]